MGSRSGAVYATAVGMEESEKLLHYETTDRILRVYYDVRHELGHGFLESVCQRAVAIALADANLRFDERVPMPVWFRGHRIGQFFADIVVEGLILLEIKACPQIEARHEAQAINYLRASQLEVGLILNFGPKPGVKRLVFTNARKERRE